MSGSERRATVPEVARLLGISERGVRDKIERGQLRAEKEGKRWIVLLPEELPQTRGSERGSDAVVDAVAGEVAGGSVTPAEVERAIEATAARYVADFAGLYDRIAGEVGGLYEAQLQAKDQALAAKDETIAELRRRAEAAEAERDELRRQAAPPAPHEVTSPPAPVEASASPVGAGVPRNWWRRLFGGE